MGVDPYRMRDEMLTNAGVVLWKAGQPKEIIEDARGRIIPVADGEFRTVMVIESKEGAIRANHWHKTDSHVMYILSGKARYVEEGPVHYVDRVLWPGDSILTLPRIPHAMEFLEDTVMIVCARNARDTETYLADIVKAEMI